MMGDAEVSFDQLIAEAAIAAPPVREEIGIAVGSIHGPMGVPIPNPAHTCRAFAPARGRVTSGPMETAEFSRHCPSPELGILTVRGELDISTSSRLQHELNDLIDAGTSQVEIDLSGVVFMDSSALSALVAAHDRAVRQSQRLTLASPSPACSKVLGITGLDQLFELT